MISCMAAVPEPSQILSFEEARHLVEAHAAYLRPRGKELVELLDQKIEEVSKASGRCREAPFSG